MCAKWTWIGWRCRQRQLAADDTTDDDAAERVGDTATLHVLAVVSFRTAGRNLLLVHVPTALTPALTPRLRQQLLLTLPMPATRSDGLPAAKAIMDGCDIEILRDCLLAYLFIIAHVRFVAVQLL